MFCLFVSPYRFLRISRLRMHNGRIVMLSGIIIVKLKWMYYKWQKIISNIKFLLEVLILILDGPPVIMILLGIEKYFLIPRDWLSIFIVKMLKLWFGQLQWLIKIVKISNRQKLRDIYLIMEKRLNGGTEMEDLSISLIRKRKNGGNLRWTRF